MKVKSSTHYGEMLTAESECQISSLSCGIRVMLSYYNTLQLIESLPGLYIFMFIMNTLASLYSTFITMTNKWGQRKTAPLAFWRKCQSYSPKTSKIIMASYMDMPKLFSMRVNRSSKQIEIDSKTSSSPDKMVREHLLGCSYNFESKSGNKTGSSQPINFYNNGQKHSCVTLNKPLHTLAELTRKSLQSSSTPPSFSSSTLPASLWSIRQNLRQPRKF